MKINTKIIIAFVLSLGTFIYQSLGNYDLPEETIVTSQKVSLVFDCYHRENCIILPKGSTLKFMGRRDTVYYVETSKGQRGEVRIAELDPDGTLGLMNANNKYYGKAFRTVPNAKLDSIVGLPFASAEKALGYGRIGIIEKPIRAAKKVQLPVYTYKDGTKYSVYANLNKGIVQSWELGGKKSSSAFGLFRKMKLVQRITQSEFCLSFINKGIYNYEPSTLKDNFFNKCLVLLLFAIIGIFRLGWIFLTPYAVLILIVILLRLRYPLYLFSNTFVNVLNLLLILAGQFFWFMLVCAWGMPWWLYLLVAIPLFLHWFEILPDITEGRCPKCKRFKEYVFDYENYLGKVKHSEIETEKLKSLGSRVVARWKEQQVRQYTVNTVNRYGTVIDSKHHTDVISSQNMKRVQVNTLVRDIQNNYISDLYEVITCCPACGNISTSQERRNTEFVGSEDLGTRVQSHEYDERDGRW